MQEKTKQNKINQKTKILCMHIQDETDSKEVIKHHG